MKAGLRWCFAAALLTWAGSARADDALAVELIPKAQVGQGQPELVVRARAALAKIILDVKRSSDGKRLKLRAGPVLPGRAHSFTLPLTQPGPARFQGSLSVEMDDGQTGSMPIDVQVELLPELQLTVAPDGLDLAARALRLSGSRPLKKAQVALMSEDGAPLGTTEVDLDAPDGDGRYAFSYEQRPGTVMRMSVKAWDVDGFFGGLDLFPWRVDIPHEEVNFRSGLAELDPPEVPKLEGSFEQVQAAIAKYGKLATISLFVAGHTDTVGDAASNRGLSERRAKAIAGWFKKRGIRIPIQAAGFGEDLLLVETPDETDEAKNRRAEYIVAVQPPRMAGREVKWQRVQ